MFFIFKVFFIKPKTNLSVGPVLFPYSDSLVPGVVLIKIFKNFDKVFKVLFCLEFLFESFFKSFVHFFFFMQLNSCASSTIKSDVVLDFCLVDSILCIFIKYAIRKYLEVVSINLRLIFPNKLPSPVEYPDQFFQVNWFFFWLAFLLAFCIKELNSIHHNVASLLV